MEQAFQLLKLTALPSVSSKHFLSISGGIEPESLSSLAQVLTTMLETHNNNNNYNNNNNNNNNNILIS